MSFTDEGYIETLRQEFRRNRDAVWADETMPLEKKQATVDQLWREFDSQRRAIEEGVFQGIRERVSQGEVGGGPVSRVTGRRMIFPRKRRRYWK
jgi:hypothetical protein